MLDIVFSLANFHKHVRISKLSFSNICIFGIQSLFKFFFLGGVICFPFSVLASLKFFF